ncbi:NAD/NADP transhydrogenase alpha subunit [Paenibacillus thermoaerophilus]|uniref:NAD/NADP transhydrogenase alpha subunit n=1 Tax=Paenibacillus thermoaerophilus TaxID=1215385 RepID=A0ABW2V5G1_9BACL|nr:NAD/NADP transhydrogenase alpha subunit [Paenibacillus thermoaerophilus]TMV18633.1 NAD/NADP transhydrogenase alpha subunit [Paenibacillus thermoaerophilus]
MKCIAVYTSDFQVFSDVYEKVLDLSLADEEETEVDGVTVSASGSVPGQYLERMRVKPDVAVMRVKGRDVTILQHRELFEILLPEAEVAVL